MKRWVKWTLGALGALLVAAAAAAVVGSQLAERKSQRQVRLNLQPVTWATAVAAPDAATLKRGKYLFNSRGCAECHGSNGAGREFINDGKGLRIAAPNISPGEGSVVARYTPEDWERTVRHGVKPDGHPVFIMPSEDYNRLTDEDTSAIISYALRLPPVPGKEAVISLPWIYKVQYGFGMIQDAAEKIDHAVPPATPHLVAATAAHGAYVANSCISCHGARLSGGKIPGSPPDWPNAANLTPGKGSAMAHYPTAQAFKAMLRSGRRPDGSAVSTVMPFGSLREMNDVDVDALHAYLKTLPPRAAGQH